MLEEMALAGPISSSAMVKPLLSLLYHEQLRADSNLPRLEGSYTTVIEIHTDQIWVNRRLASRLLLGIAVS